MLQRNVLIAFFNFFCLLCFSVIKCFFFLVLDTASLVISICYCPVPFFHCLHFSVIVVTRSYGCVICQVFRINRT